MTFDLINEQPNQRRHIPFNISRTFNFSGGIIQATANIFRDYWLQTIFNMLPLNNSFGLEKGAKERKKERESERASENEREIQ